MGKPRAAGRDQRTCSRTGRTRGGKYPGALVAPCQLGLAHPRHLLEHATYLRYTEASSGTSFRRRHFEQCDWPGVMVAGSQKIKGPESPRVSQKQMLPRCHLGLPVRHPLVILAVRHVVGTAHLPRRHSWWQQPRCPADPILLGVALFTPCSCHVALPPQLAH